MQTMQVCGINLIIPMQPYSLMASKSSLAGTGAGVTNISMAANLSSTIQNSCSLNHIHIPLSSLLACYAM